MHEKYSSFSIIAVLRAGNDERSKKAPLNFLTSTFGVWLDYEVFSKILIEFEL